MTLQQFIAQQIRNAIHGGIADSQSTLNEVADEAATQTDAHLAAGLFGGGFNLDDLLLLVPGLGEILTLPGNPIGALLGKAGRFVAAVGSGWALGEFFSEALRPFWMEITHAINDVVQSEIFDPNTSATLESKRIIDNAYGRSEAAGGNLSGEHYDKLVQSAYQHPEVGQLLDMLNRELASDAEIDDALSHHAIPQSWWAKIKATRRLLLSPADLALALLRGDITRETMLGYAHQLGVNDADMDVLVGNTGEPPGPQELMEALRRGFIDKDRFDRGIRQSRVRNEWIDVEYDLRESPMSVADAVRAVIENYITSDEGKVIAEQNGLKPEHWPIMVEAYGRPLSHEQMMTLYHRGQVTLDEVRQAFRESDLKNKYIDNAIELGRTLIAERQIVSAVDHGVLTHDDALRLLLIHGYSAADAEVLIKLGAAQRTQAHKTLTRSDILTMFTDGLMSRQDAFGHLAKLGYTQADATEMLDLAAYKVKTSLLRTAERSIEASLKAHHLTEAQAKSQLVEAGVDAAQAQSLVDQWLQQRGTPTRSLTEAQILKLGEGKFISVEDTRNRLIGFGLIAADADLLLKLNGIGPAT